MGEQLRRNPQQASDCPRNHFDGQRKKPPQKDVRQQETPTEKLQGILAGALNNCYSAGI